MTAAYDQYDYIFRIIIVGDSGVGKSSMMMQYTENVFQQSYLPTFGADFRIKTVEIGGKVLKYQFWDTAGQERFQTITHTYYRGANAILLVYDITDRSTFKNIENWLHAINQNCSDGVVKILIGNKCDMEHKRVVNQEEGALLAASLGISFYETSAKNNKNIEKAVLSAGSQWVKKIEKLQRNHSKPLKIEAKTYKKQYCC